MKPIGCVNCNVTIWVNEGSRSRYCKRCQKVVAKLSRKLGKNKKARAATEALDMDLIRKTEHLQ